MNSDALASRIQNLLGSSPSSTGEHPASRTPPPIPNHEILARIGGGAYGEVWLARSVTGTLRAVKVVWRSRFSSERPYEREFKGIVQFEPISRSHPGVVNVLHVGRDDAAGCFFYVMELADDSNAECKVQGAESPGTSPASIPHSPVSNAECKVQSAESSGTPPTSIPHSPVSNAECKVQSAESSGTTPASIPHSPVSNAECKVQGAESSGTPPTSIPHSPVSNAECKVQGAESSGTTPASIPHSPVSNAECKVQGAESPGTSPASIPHSSVCTPHSYAPRTLSSELKSRTRLPVADAAMIGVQLAGALGHLHRHGLVHRDVKPSNVIFVLGQPKLADIGLVTGIHEERSFVGTEGFIPPEGPGSESADLFALGRLLYEAVTGKNRSEFPALPDDLDRWPGAERQGLIELNEVLARACAPEANNRHGSAVELAGDLNLILAGRSVRRAYRLEQRLRQATWVAAVALVLVFATMFSNWWQRHQRDISEAQAARESALREEAQKSLARAELAEQESRRQLYTALLEQARATVLSGEMGHRVLALDAIRRAAAISKSTELRREVFAALALPDLRFERELPYGSGFASVLDPSFERIALAVPRERGPVEIRSTSDQRLLATLPPSTELPVYVMEWSVDGRFLAVKRDHPPSGMRADWEFWETAQWRRILLLPGLPLGAVAFHPRLPQVMLGQQNGVAVWDLESSTEVNHFPLDGTPFWLRFAPDGERFAALYQSRNGWIASVHQVANPVAAPLASHLFAPRLAACNWHPSGRWLALADYSGNIHGMDAQTGETRVLGRHRAEAVRAEFSPDGAYLISGAWSGELICWDAQTLRRVFSLRLGYEGQFRADGRAYGVRASTGVRLHAFEQPGGYREFTEDLGTRLTQAAFSPDGRWLAASGDQRMGLWDLTRNERGALDERASRAHGFFTPDGRELFASRAVDGGPAGFRWRIEPATNGGPPRLERLPLHIPPGFAALSLRAGLVMMTGNNGTRLFPHTEAGSGPGPDGWMPTIAGVNGASPDGRWLGVLRRGSATLHVHRMPNLEPVARLTQLAHLGKISSFEFSPAGDEVALSSSRGVELWSTTTWQRTRSLTNFTYPFLYAPDGRSLWLTKDQRGAGLYDARTMEPQLLLPSTMLPLAVSPDGRRLAVSVDGQRLQVWDLAEVRLRLRELELDWAMEQP